MTRNDDHLENIFLNIREGRGHSNINHSKQAWDERAIDGEKGLREDTEKKERSDRRIAATIDFLKGHGLLGPIDDVVDIGCGPGRFAAAFAKHCRSVLGIDISQQMVDYGREFIKENDVENVRFKVCDFKGADVHAPEWSKQFDLVFASTTPALNAPEDMERMEALSRAYCFSSVYVKAHDPLLEDIMSCICPGQPFVSKRDGRTLYAMFNLLWLRCRYPEVTYYREESIEYMPADEKTAIRLGKRLFGDKASEDMQEQIYRYLAEHADSEGMIRYPSERWYGWLLWDVRDRDSHGMS
ncbi:MAG: class I SAM-dependent methyltransferase [Clostridiales bacterium]|nr:class I SAM-dependent methyltransferase [Clostridiales bacterium]